MTRLKEWGLTFVNTIVSILGALWLMFSPFIVLVSSILTTINWYSASASIVQGILGFIVGGVVSALCMGVALVVIIALMYCVKD